MQECQAVLKGASINLARTEIKAPVSGSIGISSYTVGALVTANQENPLAVIRGLDVVYVDMTQSATHVREFKRMLDEDEMESGSTAVSLKIDGEWYKHEGKLQLREIAVNESTGMVTLRAEFPNPERMLMPEMFVRAVLEEAVDTKGILVPQQSILWDVKGNASAMVLEGDIARKRHVNVEEAGSM